MAAAPFEKQKPGLGEKPPERVKNLTFRQRAVLAAGLILMGGVPGAILTMGSVRAPPPQEYSSTQAAVMSNAEPVHSEACMAPVSKEDFKPTMNSNKGRE